MYTWRKSIVSKSNNWVPHPCKKFYTKISNVQTSSTIFTSNQTKPNPHSLTFINFTRQILSPKSTNKSTKHQIFHNINPPNSKPHCTMSTSSINSYTLTPPSPSSRKRFAFRSAQARLGSSPAPPNLIRNEPVFAAPVPVINPAWVLYFFFLSL